MSFRIFHSLLWSTHQRLWHSSLLLERKVMTNLDSMLKSRDITLPTKVCLVKAMVFPVVRYGCESWTVKKAECQRIDTFELWCWRRLLRVPWTARGSNRFILKEISPGCSLEGMMLKLKLQYFGHSGKELTHWKRLWCWEGLRARGEGDDRGWDGWMASLTRKMWVWVNSRIWWWTGRPGVLCFMGSQRVGHDWATELKWTDQLLLLFSHIADIDSLPCFIVFWENQYSLHYAYWVVGLSSLPYFTICFRCLEIL